MRSKTFHQKLSAFFISPYSIACKYAVPCARSQDRISLWAVCVSGPDLGGSQGPRPPTKRGPPTKPFNFYFALTIG